MKKILATSFVLTLASAVYAQAQASSASAFEQVSDAARTLGGAGAIIVLLTGAAIVLYKVIIGPELKNSRAAIKDNMVNSAEVAKSQTAMSENIRAASSDIRATSENLMVAVKGVQAMQTALVAQQVVKST